MSTDPRLDIMRRAAAAQPWPVPRDGALAVPLCDALASDVVQTFQAARAQIGREHYGVELVDDAGRSHLVDALQEIGDCWRYLRAEVQLRGRTGRQTEHSERMLEHANVLLHALADAVVEQWVDRSIDCDVVDTLDGFEWSVWDGAELIDGGVEIDDAGAEYALLKAVEALDAAGVFDALDED